MSDTSRAARTRTDGSRRGGAGARKGAAALVMAGLALAGCISIGNEPPDVLFTLTSTASAPVGSGSVLGSSENGAIAVLTPETPAKLEVTRVPVHVSDTEIAYLEEAFWVEKPARLFRRLLGETLRTRGDVMVFDNDDTTQLATQYVRGNLIELGYDVPTSSVVMRFDAMRSGEGGAIVTRRFEAREAGIAPEAAAVGPALNRVANTVAGEVADWVLATP